MDEIFLENKFSINLTSGEVDHAENMNVCLERKKSDSGNQKIDENFDFTSDIIDLLLCVENDENARQNIESIMDQWDEMNILGDESIKSTSNAETNGQIKIKTEENCEEKNLQTTKFIDEYNKTANSNIIIRNTDENGNDADIKNQIPGNENVTEITDKKSLTTDFRNQASNITEKGAITIKNSFLISSEKSNIKIAKCKVNVLVDNFSSTSRSFEQTRNQIPKKDQTMSVNETFTTSPFSNSQTEISAKGQCIRTDDDLLNEKIKALYCAICHKNYEQLMSSGEIKKIPCKPYPCPFCRGNYYQKSSANIHMKVHMEEEQLKCRLCVDIGETTRKITKHGNKEIENTYKNEKRLKLDSFICSICSLSLNSQTELTKHMTIHKSTLKFCRKYLKKQSDFAGGFDCECQRKINGHASNSEKSRTCRKCGKTSINYCLNKFECKICAKQFANKTNYDFHCLSHNAKFTKIFDNIITEKSNCSSLDHNYGKPVNTSDDTNSNRCNDQTQNVNKSKMKLADFDQTLNNAGSSLMDIDETAYVSDENSKQLNQETATNFSSMVVDQHVTQYDFGLPKYLHREQSSKVKSVYMLQNKIIGKSTSSSLLTSQLTESSLFTNTFYSQYIKPEINMSIDEIVHNSNVDEMNCDSENKTSTEKDETKEFINSHVVYQENFDSNTNITYKNSTMSDESNLLSNVTNHENTSMLNSGLVSNDMNELQSDELISKDIDNIFQQYFYSQNDEKILHNDFVENAEEQPQTQFSTLNHVPLIAASNNDLFKIDKTITYNSTADTLSQFINTNMNDGTDLQSNEIIQELFSNMDNTKSKHNKYQSINVPISTTQNTNESNSALFLNENKNIFSISNNSNNFIKTQNISSAISLTNNSICLNNVLANISNSVTSMQSDTLCHNQVNAQNSSASNIIDCTKTSISTPKSYLVIYVLPPSSNNPQSNVKPLVTELKEQKTVVSSTTTKETNFKLPIVEGKTTYLVPIINNKVDNANRTNESIVKKNYTNKTQLNAKRCEKIQKNKLNDNNGSTLKNVCKSKLMKSQQEDIKTESRVDNVNSKSNGSTIILPNIKYKSQIQNNIVEKSNNNLKHDIDHKNDNNLREVDISYKLNESNLNTTTLEDRQSKNNFATDSIQKYITNTTINGNYHKRNILQIAYDDACKLIEDSVTKNIENKDNGTKNSSMISINSEKTQVTTKNVTSSMSATSNNMGTTLTGNYTILKQILNSKTSLLTDNGKKTDDNSKYFQIPVEISFKNGQVTFQYSQNNLMQSSNPNEISNPLQYGIQNEENNTNQQIASSTFKSENIEKSTCEICHKIFMKSEFLSHLKTHNKTLYKCTYCQEIFVQQLNLIQHMKIHLQQQVFNCKMCKKSFNNIFLFRLHLLIHKGLLFICVSCIKLFNKKEEYENHLKTHNQNYLTCAQCKKNFPNTVNNSDVIQYFTCIECISSGKKFEQNESINQKIILKEIQFGSNLIDQDVKFSMQPDNQINEDIKNDTIKEEPNPDSFLHSVNEIVEDLCFECQYCDRICNGGVQFKIHKLLHIQNEIKCVICGEQFAKFTMLVNHFKMHNIRKSFKCDFCSDTFYDKISYQNHSHKNCKSHPCAICDGLFLNKTDLVAHFTSHISNSEFICNFCGLKFTSTNIKMMLTHKTIHMTEEILECNKCDEKFVLQSELKIHYLEVHDKKFICALCDQHFENNESYLNHHRIHKLFKCDTCNSTLISEELLLKHKQIHLKKLFTCKHCKLEFEEFNSLLSHTIKFHSGKDLKCFKCSCCSKFFTNESQWSDHGISLEKKAVLLPYSLKQFNDHSFKLEPDIKNIYSCHQCNENFRNKSEIIKHIKSH